MLLTARKGLNRLIKHFAALGLTTFIRLLTSFVLFVLIAREWGAAAFGEFMYFFSIAALFVQVCEYGFSQQILRDIGRDPASAVLKMSEFFAAKIWLTVLTVVGAFIYVAVARLAMQQMLTLLMLLTAAALMSYSDFMMACFRATGRYGRETVITGFGNTIYFLLALIALYSGCGGIWVASAFALGRFLHLIFTYFEYNKWMPSRQRPDFRWSTVLPTIKNGSVYGLNIAVGMLFVNLDTILITHTLGFEATGTYQAAARFYQGAAMLPPIFAGVFLPKIAASVGNDAKLNLLVAKLNWLMLAAGILVSAFFLSGPYFYGWIYPDPSLSTVGQLLPWFGVLIIISFYASAQGIIVTAYAGHSLRAAMLIAAVILLVVSAFPLLDIFGTKGMIMSVALAYLLISVSFWFWLQLQGVAAKTNALAALVAATASLVIVTIYSY